MSHYSVDLSSITNTNAISTWDDHGELLGKESEDPLHIIYGRNIETQLLRGCYQRLFETKQPQIGIVHGESGSGKTALVDVLRDSVCQSQGYFVGAKYFQNAGTQEPLSAIMAAFSDLCDLMAQSDDFDEEKRLQIKKGLGTDSQLLIKSVSSLSSFLGEELDGNKEHDQATIAAKFNGACKTFLRVMASNMHPVVVFLDDIQWADEGSRRLIGMLLQDVELKNVMIVLAYRQENAVQVKDILVHTQDATDIELSNLGLDAVHEMVCGMLRSTSDSILDLSQLVLTRSGGNPLHVILLVETIAREGLIFYNDGGRCWEFNIPDIQRQIMASDTVAELLAMKVKKLLSSDLVTTLKVASLLGYHFPKSILLEVASILVDEIRSKNSHNSSKSISAKSYCTANDSLAIAVKEGFLEISSDHVFQWPHDRLQFYFQGMLNEREEDRLNLLIGNAYLASADKENSNVFNAATHLNRSASFVSDKKQSVILSKINQKAAWYCEKKSAFGQAAALYQTGLELLGPQGRWSDDNFTLTFSLSESLARTQLIIGDFECCKQTTKETLKHGKTVDMQINLLLIGVEVRMAGNEVDDALAAAFQALEILGIEVRHNISKFQLMRKLLKVKRLLRGKTDDGLMSLPLIQDRRVTSAVKLLMHACAYLVVKDQVNPGIFAALLAVELTLKTGLSPYSSSAFVVYGVAWASLGNITRGIRYTQLALTILGNEPTNEAIGLTVGFGMIFVIFWEKPMIQLLDPLFEAAKVGHQCGDILYATFCCSMSFLMRIFTGEDLVALETSARERYAVVSEFGQDGMVLWLQTPLQYVLNMRSDMSNWESISIISGEVMNEKEYFCDVYNAGHPILVMIALVVKAELACWFEQFSVAAGIFKDIAAIDESLRKCYAAPVYFFNAARTYYSLFEKSGERRHLRLARSHRKLLKRFVTAKCPNAMPLETILAVQDFARRRSIKEPALHKTYRQGIKCMVEKNLVHYEGLLNEIAGFDFAQRGQRTEAEEYFDRALYLYKHKWRSTAKYNWLSEKKKHALTTPMVDVSDKSAALSGIREIVTLQY